MVLFHWPKTIMPTPFRSPERKQELIRQYGGVDSQGYQQNVLGLDGDVSGSVFPFERFIAITRHIPEYLHLELSIEEGSVWFAATAHRPPSGGSSRAYCQPVQVAAPRECQRMLHADDERWREFLSQFVTPLDAPAFCGIDVGWTVDPTEIVVNLAEDIHRWILRVTLLRFESPVLQRCVVCALDRVLGMPSLGWGLDSTGRGVSLETELVHCAPSSHGFVDRVSGFNLGESVEARDPETGVVINDTQSGKPRRMTNKGLATTIIDHLIGGDQLAYPRDQAIVNQWTRHTARVSQREERIFSREDDHTIDAQRVAELRWFHQTLIAEEPKAVRYRRVPGARRRSLKTLRKF